MKKKNIVSNVSERDKMLLYILFSILILAVAYFLVFKPCMSKAAEYQDKNKELKLYITELDAKIAGQAEKEALIKEYNDHRTEVLNRFFGGMTHEKAIVILADLAKEVGLKYEEMGIAVNEVYFNQEEAMANNVIQKENTSSVSTIAVQGTPEQTYDKLTGYKTTLTVDFACSSDELKKTIDFINDYDEKIALDSIVVGYDETTGKLAGTMVICMYSGEGIVDADGNPKAYEAPDTGKISSGVVNIFGSKETYSKKKKK
ncbi:MAG: hypothetical protein II073_05490 [Lachnospiraceae bacterium]|nr:hypothetical protein [Lachnospiraceae bacterium]